MLVYTGAADQWSWKKRCIRTRYFNYGFANQKSSDFELEISPLDVEFVDELGVLSIWHVSVLETYFLMERR